MQEQQGQRTTDVQFVLTTKTVEASAGHAEHFEYRVHVNRSHQVMHDSGWQFSAQRAWEMASQDLLYAVWDK